MRKLRLDVSPLRHSRDFRGDVPPNEAVLRRIGRPQGKCLLSQNTRYARKKGHVPRARTQQLGRSDGGLKEIIVQKYLYLPNL